MKKELEDLLCQRYPKLFVERTMSIEESCMGRGIECEDGWFDIIDAFCAKVQTQVKYGMPPVTLKQVKQKFGTLIIYFAGGDAMTRGMAYMAEAMSEKICEVCGEYGGPVLRVRDNVRVMTRCMNHTPQKMSATER